ncbi:hypothetical protein BRADI_5g01115v3 [Brachypodium distachyon]|uniref:Disease resistance R13L4/SHOC-2-like LRR domain-containing protein n=1 Tax=Brachypodium distachyon TaxID=15368 RepID=A0A2K2CES7_BRADI|nr:hypothetical protein BRADI_5g01115v3 [Brachypodium distachyon]PNT60525.1 hypothetical protein BRADI_5g01115v3 [Brachypodium distachyon]PNT60526.1 hypothetical protein BRADI_5g01115v3 [Brachypodium distachyon]PNT60527.1 hypothetical protein BRADI_5g01115v3 [Brachypodium distachyon]PNT60528.1 hypothetical protein BRADI_5g01115v3 [Brachypodium distachyon]
MKQNNSSVSLEGKINHLDSPCFSLLARMSTLHIIKCSKMKVKPSFPSSLESLVLASSNMQLLLSPGSPDPLDAVATGFCSASTSNALMLPFLKVLRLVRMMVPSSDWVMLQQLTALRSLEISSCNDLTRLPESMQNFASLQQLMIWNCASLWILPEWIGKLGSLQMIDIRRCTGLTSLPQSMVHLNSLQYLTIGYCDALQLPEWLGKLQSLRSLDVWGLP